MTPGPIPTDPPTSIGSLPGEPGVTTDRDPPFIADDDATRWLFSLNRFGIRPGLRRIEGLLTELDHPEREVPAIVVAGTNGKGSTTRILAALLQEAGYRVASFTSPHLLRVHERLTINDIPVARESFAAAIERLRPAVDQHGASWFETLTALALDICRREKVDILCCETGLGGRLDATNALPALATILVSVSLDHRQVLGSTLAEIAAEKLGLLKRGIPLFCAVDRSLRTQVFAAAVAAGSPCHFLDELAQWQESPDGWRLVTRRGVTRGLPRQAAAFLQRNMALALLCLEELAAKGVVRLPPAPAAVLRRVFLPGRFQLVLTEPDWLVDTAHNAAALCACLDAFLTRPCAGRRRVLFGCMQDKEIGLEVGARLRACDTVVAAPVNLARSRNQDELAALLAEWGMAGGEHFTVASDVRSAVDRLAGELVPADTVLVTGSCFLVAEVLYCLGYRDLDQTRQPRPAHDVLTHRES